MAVYPAYFERGEGGHVVVSFPDLPGCFTQGDTEAEAMMAYPTSRLSAQWSSEMSLTGSPCCRHWRAVSIFRP